MHDNADYGKSASSDTLREQVAAAIRETCRLHFDGGVAGIGLDDGTMADAAIRVVLAAVAERITARCDMLLHGAYGDDAMHELGAALADVVRLGDGHAVPE